MTLERGAGLATGGPVSRESGGPAERDLRVETGEERAQRFERYAQRHAEMKRASVRAHAERASARATVEAAMAEVAEMDERRRNDDEISDSYWDTMDEDEVSQEEPEVIEVEAPEPGSEDDEFGEFHPVVKAPTMGGRNRGSRARSGPSLSRAAEQIHRSRQHTGHVYPREELAKNPDLPNDGGTQCPANDMLDGSQRRRRHSGEVNEDEDPSESVDGDDQVYSRIWSSDEEATPPERTRITPQDRPTREGECYRTHREGRHHHRHERAHGDSREREGQYVTTDRQDRD
jgi:hypothetical protein